MTPLIHLHLPENTYVFYMGGGQKDEKTGGGACNSTCREESLKKSDDISLTREVQIGHLDQPTAESVTTAVVRSLNVMY